MDRIIKLSGLTHLSLEHVHDLTIVLRENNYYYKVVAHGKDDYTVTWRKK